MLITSINLPGPGKLAKVPKTDKSYTRKMRIKISYLSSKYRDKQSDRKTRLSGYANEIQNAVLHLLKDKCDRTIFSEFGSIFSTFDSYSHEY